MVFTCMLISLLPFSEPKVSSSPDTADPVCPLSNPSVTICFEPLLLSGAAF
jgi:hypothetical protein